MEDVRIAQRYAGALFQAALANNSVAAIGNDLTLITVSIQAEPRLRDFLFSPETPRENKVELCEKAFGNKISVTTLHFLMLLLDKRRENEIEAIQIEYDSKSRDFEKTTHVLITSAFELSEREQGLLIEKSRTLTGTDVEVQFEVDKNLIGGVKIGYSDKVFDDTLRGHLNKLRDYLAHDLTKV